MPRQGRQSKRRQELIFLSEHAQIPPPVPGYALYPAAQVWHPNEMNELSSSVLSEAHAAAITAQANAHAPYSNYFVGAALVLEGSQSIVAGCNVENASYGGTICAERNAVTAAVSQFGAIRIQGLVLVTRPPAATPCGMCLQVLVEFADPATPIYCGTPENPGAPRPLSDFLPFAFDAGNLE